MAISLKDDRDIKAWHQVYEESSEWLDMLDTGFYAKLFRSHRRAMERRFAPSQHFSKVIEVGCGTGGHLDFVRHSFDSYIMCDRSAEHLEAAKIKHGKDPRVTYSQQDGTAMDFPDNSFDRLITIDTLEHIPNSWDAVQEFGRVVRPGGVVHFSFPAEGGLAWRLGRHLTTRRAAIKTYKLDYDFVIATEHVNTASNLISVTKHYFPQADVKMWPFGGKFVDLNISVDIIIKK